MKVQRLKPQYFIDLRDVDEKDINFIGSVARSTALVTTSDLTQVELDTTSSRSRFTVSPFDLRPNKPISTVNDEIVAAICHGRLTEENILLQRKLFDPEQRELALFVGVHRVTESIIPSGVTIVKG